MIPAFVISSVGMVAGVAAFLLGVAQLTCEHARSALLPRVTTFILTILAGWTAIDSWDAWSGCAGMSTPRPWLSPSRLPSLGAIAAPSD